MNNAERRLLTKFLDQLKGAKVISKDPDAEALIAAASAQQPDATYLLIQKALLQERALEAAKAQIAQLQERLDSRSTTSRGGFLAQDPWAVPARSATSAPPPSGSGALGSFLGTAAAAAAGIAGGAFLFQGLESLLGHHGSGVGSEEAAAGPLERTESLAVNEYYDTDDHEAEPELREADFDPADTGFDAYDDDDDDGSLNV